MKRFALAAALVLVALFPASVSAAVKQYDQDAGLSCTQIWHEQGDPLPFVCMTESSQYSGDKLTASFSSDISDLADIPHVPSSFCSPWIAPPDNWNDCISAIWVKMGTNDSACFYRDGNYNDRFLRFSSPGSPAGAVFTYSVSNLENIVRGNDELSSVMLTQSGTPCS